MAGSRYCLDANVLIQSWQKYYNPRICPQYWSVLSELGRENRIFVPQAVYEEILRGEDDLADWLHRLSHIPVEPVTEAIALALRRVYDFHPSHRTLVDNARGRSLADPWLVAHAFAEGAIVVTKEEKVTALNAARIKIPNVCDNMGIRWMNDFDFVADVGLQFGCSRT